MARRKLWVVILAGFVVGTLGMGVPSVPAMPADGGEPGLLACAEVIGNWMEIEACTMFYWEACMHFLLDLGLGLTAEQIIVCGDYIEKGASEALCKLDGRTWFPGNPPLCIPCGKPGYDCYTVVGDGGGGGEEEGHNAEQQEYIDMPGWGGGGGGFNGWFNGWIVAIPRVDAQGCWVIYDENGCIKAFGCN